MNKRYAKKIAQYVTNEQLQEMFNAAKVGVKDWTKVSSVNKGMTKGTSWNILAKDFDMKYTYHIISKTNMIREFGEFLPDEINMNQNIKEAKPKYIPVHQDPQF